MKIATTMALHTGFHLILDYNDKEKVTKADLS